MALLKNNAFGHIGSSVTYSLLFLRARLSSSGKELRCSSEEAQSYVAADSSIPTMGGGGLARNVEWQMVNARGIPTGTSIGLVPSRFLYVRVHKKNKKDSNI